VANTVIGGLLVSTLLTLVVIPVVYSLMDRKKWRSTDASLSDASARAQTAS
jgi:HAE1 family hydrophobic/amphiphilic exporter-1